MSDLVVRKGFPLASELNPDSFARIMRAWNLVIQMINRTREYETGLYGVRTLITFAENNRDLLAETQRDTHMAFLYNFELDMLDRLDRWDEYLRRWDELRSEVQIAFEKHVDPGWWAWIGEKTRPFIIRQDGDRVWVHFISGREHRRQIIQRKVIRASAGRRMGSYTHRSRTELTTEEVERRIAELLSAAVIASHSPR